MFRDDIYKAKTNHLLGDISIAVPIAWQSIGFLIFGGIATITAFQSFASYSRVETVTGAITPDTGVSSIVPSRAGVITALTVKDGQNVAAGAELASIRTEEDGTMALSPAALLEAAITRQDASLAA